MTMELPDALLDNPAFALFALFGTISFVWLILRPRASSIPKNKYAEPVVAAKAKDETSSAAAAASSSARSRSVGMSDASGDGTAGGSATAGGGSKKKKKKKGKAKKVEPEKEGATAEAAVAAAAAAPASKTAAAAATPTPAISGGGGGGTGGKKKKKKQASKASAIAPVPAAPAPKKKTVEERPPPKRPEPVEDDSDDDNDSDREKESEPAPVPSVPSNKPRTLDSFLASGGASNRGQRQQADLDDGWGVVAGDKKKNRKKKGGGGGGGGAQKASAAAAASNVETRESVTIDSKKVGIVIGPKGATMQGVQDATGAKIEVNAPPRDAPGMGGGKASTKATVVITGTSDDIKRAKAAIRELCDKGYTTVTQDKGFVEQSVSVHPQVLSELVGPGGSVIRAMQEKLQVRVTIPPTDWSPNDKYSTQKVKHVRVGVAGSRDACVKGKACIQQIARYHHHEITHPGLVHEEVDVPPEYLHGVIGTRGSEMRHIKGNYGCDVYIPNADSYSEYVIVVGKPAMVKKAVVHIENLMDRTAQMRERSYEDEY